MNAGHNKSTTQRPKRRLAPSIILALIAAAAFATYWHYTQRPRAFIKLWTERFRAVDSLQAAEHLAESEPVIVRSFPSGEWLVATCEHSCCSGAGFDATVIRDSTSAVYADTTYTFCGIEGLGGELPKHAASLPDFYSALTQLKLLRQ